jgi:hypothetical protein
VRLPDSIRFVHPLEVSVDVGENAMTDINGEDFPVTELTVVQLGLNASSELIRAVNHAGRQGFRG